MPKKRKFDLVIWDWNGTLMDDYWFFYEQVMRMIFARYAAPLPPMEAYRKEVGADFMDFYHSHGIPKEATRDDLFTIAEEAYKIATIPPNVFPDAKQALEAINANGIRQILVSGSPFGRLMEEIGRVGLERYFEVIIGDAHGKAEIFLECLREMNCIGKRVAAVGDIANDALAAIHVHATPYICPRGYQDYERMEELLQGQRRPCYVANLKILLRFIL